MAIEIPGFSADKHPELHLQRLMTRPDVSDKHKSEVQGPTILRRVAAVGGTLLRRPGRLVTLATEAGITSGAEYLLTSVPAQIQGSVAMEVFLGTIPFLVGELSIWLVNDYKMEKAKNEAEVGIPVELPKQPLSVRRAWETGKVQRAPIKQVFVRGKVPPLLGRYRREERHTKEGP